MNNIPTIAEAIQAARESTRIAELDIRRAVSAACGYTDAGGAALHKVLEDSILPICNVAKLLSHLLQFPEGVTVHAAANSDNVLLVGALAPDSAQNDMAQYRQMLGRVQRDTEPSRIPHLLAPIAIDDGRDIAAWARAMIAAELAYNIADDPGDITLEDGKPMFTERECRELRDIVTTFSEEEAEEYLAVLVARVHEQASEPPLEQPEPPPAPTSPGARCHFVREDGKRCNCWLFDLQHLAEHQHRFQCAGKVPGTNPAEPCDGDEGHSGPCFQIPF